MKTTCVCCGTRATHETVRSVGGTWFRCNTCNYAWRGLRAYLISVVANIWWPVKGPSQSEATPRPLSEPPTPTSRSQGFQPGRKSRADLKGSGEGAAASRERPKTTRRARVDPEGPASTRAA
jgi:hypothetical protein